MNWNAPSMAWLFLLALPLILFYFLKLKRPVMNIPSLYLWRQVLDDQRVNSPFQRFKKHILLLLQLLLLLFIILAALQPSWRGSGGDQQRLPVLIDNSASMGALDKDGLSRLDVVKKQVTELIDGLHGDQEMCLISFSNSAHKLSPFTNNQRILREALEKITIEDVGSRIENALQITRALSQDPPGFSEVLLYSDGNLPLQTNFELPFTVSYRKVEPAEANIAITSFNAQHGGQNSWNVFARLDASKGSAISATATLYQDEVKVGNENITCEGGQPERLVFSIEGDKLSQLRLELTPQKKDSLASDNQAHLTLPVIRPLFVYVHKDLGTFLHALGILKGLRLSSDPSDAPFDLVITDKVEDLDLSSRVTLSTGMIPTDIQELISYNKKDNVTIIDWNDNTRLLQHVELRDMIVLDCPEKNKNVPDNELEELDYQILIHGSKGPLLLQKDNEQRLDIHMLFHIDNSTLPYRVGFPIFVSNLMELTRHLAGLSKVEALTTGVLPDLLMNAEESYRIESPDEKDYVLKSDAKGWLRGCPAKHVGPYKIYEQSTLKHTLPISLLNREESQLASVDSLLFNENLKVKANASQQFEAEKNLWPYLAAAGILLLLLEWWYFQKRPWRKTS